MQSKSAGYGGMIFACGIALLLMHAIPANDLLFAFGSFEPTVHTITGSAIVGYMAIAAMIYGILEGLVKRARPHAMTIALAVISCYRYPSHFRSGCQAL